MPQEHNHNKMISSEQIYEQVEFILIWRYILFKVLSWLIHTQPTNKIQGQAAPEKMKDSFKNHRDYVVSAQVVINQTALGNWGIKNEALKNQTISLYHRKLH